MYVALRLASCKVIPAVFNPRDQRLPVTGGYIWSVGIYRVSLYLCHSVYEGGDVLVHGQSVPSLGFFYFSRETVVREGNISECHAVAVKTAVGIYDFLIISALTSMPSFSA